MEKCSNCEYWQPHTRSVDEESPCSKLGEVGVRAFPSRFGTKLVTPREFGCNEFRDAESSLNIERQFEKWFPLVEDRR